MLNSEKLMLCRIYFPDIAENNEGLGSGGGCLPIDVEDCVGETTNPPNIKIITEATNDIVGNNTKGSFYSGRKVFLPHPQTYEPNYFPQIEF